MRTTAEIVRESVAKAMYGNKSCFHRKSEPVGVYARRIATAAATYACELAQADAAALLKPVTMRKTDQER